MLSFITLMSLGCGDGEGGGLFSRPPKDGDNADNACGGDSDEPDPETECFDGEDNDGDGKTDCEDSDCLSAYEECSWPDVIDHRSVFDFQGRKVTCETFWGDFDEDVPDCQTAFNSALGHTTDGPQCQECDRTYFGTFEYTADSCGDLYGDGSALPTEGRFGFIFVDENVWELWGIDDATGQWEKAVDLKKGSDGRYTYTAPKETVEYDSGECDNDPLYVGDLIVEISFTPR